MDDLLVLVDVVAGGNQDVIHIDEEFSGVAHLHFLEHVVHGSLEGGQGVGESKEHNAWFKESFWGFEGCFPLVPFLDLDIVIPPPYVKLGEEALPF